MSDPDHAGPGRPTLYEGKMPEPGLRVRFPQEALDWLGEEADESEVSMAQVVRDLVDRERLGKRKR